MGNLIETVTNKRKVGGNSRIDKISSKNIYDVLRIVYILNIIFGLRVFEIPRDRSRRLLSWLYSMSFFGLNYGNFYYCSVYLTSTKVHTYSDILSKIIMTMNYVVIFVIITMGLRQTESVKLCARKLHEIDKTLRELGSSSSFNEIYKKTIFCLMITMITMVLLYGAATLKMVLENNPYYKSQLFILSIIAYSYNFMIEFILVLEFLTIVRCVKSEFQRANDLLSNVNILPISSIASKLIERSLPIDSNKLFNLSSSLPKMHSQLQVETHKINRSRTLLRTIRQVHLELCKLSEHFSLMYGIQISLEIVMCIVFNTYSLYDFYIKYYNKIQKLYDLNLLIPTILFCSPYMIRIFIVNFICDKTTKEAERTNEIIHTFYGNNTDFEIQREVEIFSLQMIQRRTTFTAFGFYNLNCKRIVLCIGVITTYLVILIQVSDSMKKGL